MKKILFVIGTRPEAIKMAPVVRRMREVALNSRAVNGIVCVTAQHRGMLDEALREFSIAPDIDLNLMRAGQSPISVLADAARGLHEVIEREKPHITVVHGDTTTTLAASLASTYSRVPVAHVEAGLRTLDIFNPWPEEINRRVATTVAHWHFAPTPLAKRNLVDEGVDESRIWVTGNTAVDAILSLARRFEGDVEYRKRYEREFDFLPSGKRIVLVTCHRRESHGSGVVEICAALKQIASRGDSIIVFPVHPSPSVRGPVGRELQGHPNVYLIEPQRYSAFCYLMWRSCLILSDSGGIQEEAPSLRKPVLVMRDVTERPEGAEAGTLRLVGTDKRRIAEMTMRLLDDRADYEQMAAKENPYGDGHAAGRIVDVLLRIS